MQHLSWPSFEVEVTTPVHRLKGRMRLPPSAATADYLNLESKEFLPLEDVSVEDRRGEFLLEAGFVGLAKASILWLAGGRPGQVQASPQVLTRRRAAVFFADHVLVGEVEMLKTLDLPAFFSKTKPFVTFFDAQYYPLPGFDPEKPPLFRYDFVALHIKRIEGVVELSREEAHPRWGGLY